MQIQEAAKLAGVTVRTLHYYDKIGLLKPAEITEAGYRIYYKSELEQLQQILFFRELGFPLKEIKEMVGSPQFDRKQALRKQKVMLELKRNRLERLIDLVDKELEGERFMGFEAFDQKEIEKQKALYSQEVKARWGDSTAYAESREKTQKYDREKWGELMQRSNEIFNAFAAIRDQAPDCDAAKILVKEWQDFISENYYNCTDEILHELGQMYVGDDRFRQSLDRYGKGTAEFLSAAIEHTVGERKAGGR